MEHKAGRTGFEIRADILELAQNLVIKQYEAEHAEWLVTSHADWPGQVAERPALPTVEKIIETATKMNEFVGRK